MENSRDLQVAPQPPAAQIVGLVALVTGASRGIGRAVALALGKAGASVAVNYRERRSEADEVVAELRALGQRALAVQADVSVSAQVSAMVKAVAAELGAVDILVNNAGVAVTRGFEDLDEAEFDHTLAVNLKSAFLCTQAVLAGMRAKRWGRIVNVSSIAARGAGAVGVHYNASKAGLEGLTRGYASRLAKEGITVNAIAPGATETEMGALLSPDVLLRIPAGRFATPDEMAQAVLMMVGNAFLTGQTIAVNGGSMFV
jgi:3-oxoacyl-[acyl-carrier protein] reductase